MNLLSIESSRDSSSQVRFAEIASYLQELDFKRNGQELPNITPEERKFLAYSIRDLYVRAKRETNEAMRLQLMARFYDCLTLLLCDPSERKMAYCPPQEVERVVFKDRGDCLCFGTGTSGERVYFETYSGDERTPGRYMVYPHSTDSVTEVGRKYYKRFNEAFEVDKVNLDKLVLEDLD